jgi:hypothetical protein
MRLPGFLKRHTVSVEPYTGTGAYGPQYGAAVSVKCFKDDVRRLVRMANGDEVTSAATLYSDLSENVPLNSRVTLPGDPVTTYFVLALKRHDGAGLGTPDHLEVSLG